jgi:hypothetical protein
VEGARAQTFCLLGSIRRISRSTHDTEIIAEISTTSGREIGRAAGGPVSADSSHEIAFATPPRARFLARLVIWQALATYSLSTVP